MDIPPPLIGLVTTLAYTFAIYKLGVYRGRKKERRRHRENDDRRD